MLATVPGVRHMLIILSSVLSSLVPSLLGADPAAAHVCAQPVEVAVDQPATVTVGVGAEAAAVTAVEIELPDGFRLTEASAEGWDVDVREGAVRFAGGSVAPFACGYVTLRGVAEERAALVFPLVVETADGASLNYDNTEPFLEDSAQLVYAGVDMPTGLPSAEDDMDPAELVGWLLLAVGVVLAGGLGVSRWRGRRVEQNKGS
jgi:hypothetical protein